MFQKQGSIAPLAENRRTMGSDHDDSGSLDEALQTILRALEKPGIARTDQLIE